MAIIITQGTCPRKQNSRWLHTIKPPCHRLPPHYLSKGPRNHPILPLTLRQMGLQGTMPNRRQVQFSKEFSILLIEYRSHLRARRHRRLLLLFSRRNLCRINKSNIHHISRCNLPCSVRTVLRSRRSSSFNHRYHKYQAFLNSICQMLCSNHHQFSYK